MDEKKPSTADIMAKIRAQKAAAAGAAPAPAAEPAAPPAAEAPAPAAAPAKPAAPAAPAGKPGSTADILAAIRAKKAGAADPAIPAAATPAATPAAPAAAAATSAAAGPAKPLPSIAEMVKAAKPGAAAPVAPKVPAVAPPMPAKPVLGAKKGAPAPARRSLAGIVSVTAISLLSLVLGTLFSSPVLIAVGVFVWCALLTPFAMAWSALGAVTGIATLGTARFMFPHVLVEPPSKFKVGPASDYPLNTVSNKWKDQFGIWIVHTDQYEGKDLVYALSTVCTHLGCTPSWLDGEQKFKCPCHGSGFYITGVNFEGPAPRPLERVGLRIAEDGMLEVDKSVKFQEEMGQWVDATSFVDGALA